MTETSEEMPTANYVQRVYRTLSERGILERGKQSLWVDQYPKPRFWIFRAANTHAPWNACSH
jgi:hypothetical protein